MSLRFIFIYGGKRSRVWNSGREVFTRASFLVGLLIRGSHKQGD
jgi:hypothetical protein